MRPERPSPWIGARCLRCGFYSLLSDGLEVSCYLCGTADPRFTASEPAVGLVRTDRLA